MKIKPGEWIIHNVWPWSRISELQEEILHAAAVVVEATNEVVAANERYKSAFMEGFNLHRVGWLAQANMFYGPKPFSDDQKRLLNHLYDQNQDFRSALDILKAYEGIGFRA